MKKQFLTLLLGIMLLTSCNTSKEILYFQDIVVNQPEVIEGARDITVQPKDQISITVSSKDPQLAALFNLTRVQYRAGAADLRSSGNNGEISGYTLDDKGNIDFPVIGTLHIAGMTKSQIFFKVTLLQVIKRVIPPMGNEFINLVKDTALARTIAVYEVLWMGEKFIKSAGIIWPLFYTAVFYLLFNGILTLLFGWIEKKMDSFK